MLIAGAMAVAVVPAARANSYTGVKWTVLQSMCFSHGTRQWPMYPSGSITVPTQQLQQGSYGDCVAYGQILLDMSNAGNPAVDGDFGPQTEAAVLTFQNRMLSNGKTWCGPADGVIGPRTWYCLQAQG